jgi:hypothetical protein
VASYVAAWNTRDDAARRRLLEQAWSTTGTYTDPVVHLDGRAAMYRHATGFGERWPGAKIVITGEFPPHNGLVCFSWHVVGPVGDILRAGVDFGELDPDGRLSRVVGFFGEPSAPPGRGDR